MFINNFDPVAFEFLAFEIRWYSLSYIVGIVLSWIYIKKFIVKNLEEQKSKVMKHVLGLVFMMNLLLITFMTKSILLSSKIFDQRFQKKKMFHCSTF